MQASNDNVEVSTFIKFNRNNVFIFQNLGVLGFWGFGVLGLGFRV